MADTFNIVCEGDSITFGLGVSTAEAWPAQLKSTWLDNRGLGETWTVQNVAQSNRTAADADANYATRIAPLYNAGATKNIAIFWTGTNDLFFTAGQQAATIAAIDSWVAKAFATGFDYVYVLDIIQRGYSNVAHTEAALDIWRTEAANVNAHITTAAAGHTPVNVRSLEDVYQWEIQPERTLPIPGGAAKLSDPFLDHAHLNETGLSGVAEFINNQILLILPIAPTAISTYQLEVNGVVVDIGLYATDDPALTLAGENLEVNGTVLVGDLIDTTSEDSSGIEIEIDGAVYAYRKT